MKCPRARLGFTATSLFLLVVTAPATAQYMYLDSNGDGVHTAADQVSANGLPTTVDVYLITNRNRDGSEAVCNQDPNDPLRAISYVVNLMAVGGTVTYSNFTNAVPAFTTNFGELNPDGVRYKNGLGGSVAGSLGPGGPFKLCTIRITGQTGAPRIDIVDLVSGSPDFTSFGGPCDGNDLDSTYKLAGPGGGSDWTDVDGLPAGSGGSPNSPPVLSQPADMSVSVGETASQILTATDPDRLPLTFSKASGPAYFAVETTDPGAGAAAGLIHLAPFLSDVGSATATISVSDGEASDQKTFGITVHPSTNHNPLLSGVSDIAVVAGRVARRVVNAGDPDGHELSLFKAEGPAWMNVTTLSSKPGGTSGSIRVNPTICDVGSSPAKIGVSDGVVEDRQPFTVTVVSPQSPPSPTQHEISIDPVPVGIAAGDLNLDGKLDLATVHEFSNVVTVLLGRGNGEMDPPIENPLGLRHTSLAIAELNQDGLPDLAVTNHNDASLTILLGKGNGTFDEGATYPTGVTPLAVAAIDLNRDGIIDLAVANRNGTEISVLLGAGNGTFHPKTDTRVATGPMAIGAGDFNLDGHTDLAVPCGFSGTLTILLGLGDGGFGERSDINLGGAPFSVAVGDWNWDGATDLAVANFSQRVQILLGNGDGSFAITTITDFISPQTIAADDFNADGNFDLAVADISNTFTVALYGGGDGTFGTRENFAVTGHSVATGDLNLDGLADIAVTLSGQQSRVFVLLNQNGVASSVEARAFQSAGSRVLPNSNAGSTFCLRLEPVNDSYRNTDLDLTSLTLSSTGTGSIDQISAIEPKTIIEGDSDRNGVPELPACFARADFARLIDQVHGRRTVAARIQGATFDGRRFCAKVDLEVIGTGGPLTASVSPNPLNPRATLRFSTSRNGFVRARMYDLQGRVVRTLLDRSLVEAGTHEIPIDGRADSGERLASGIYFYEVDASEGKVRGRLTILK